MNKANKRDIENIIYENILYYISSNQYKYKFILCVRISLRDGFINYLVKNNQSIIFETPIIEEAVITYNKEVDKYNKFIKNLRK